MLRIAARQSTATTARVFSRFDSLSIADAFSRSESCSPTKDADCDNRLHSNYFTQNQQQQQQQQQQQRFFSQAPRSSRGKQEKGPLMNERLVKFLVKRSPSSNANDITVRLVIQPPGSSSPDQKASTEMVTLMRAVEVSTELGIDLVGINVEQNPPIIKALDYAKVAYKSEKNKSSKSTSNKTVKEFKFKGTIAENDMMRKAENVIKYLKKGHTCQLTILSNAYARRKDPNCVENILNRLQAEVGDAAINGKLKANKEKTQATLMLQPNNKKP